MNDRLQELYKSLFARSMMPDEELRLRRMVQALPREMRDSPAVLCDIILRADHIGQMQRIVQTASFEAQQRIYRDLPLRIDEAALKALNAIRDKIPINSADREIRAMRLLIAWSVFLIAIIAFFTVASTRWWLLHDGYTHQAATDQAFDRCVVATTASLTDIGALPTKRREAAVIALRNGLGQCAAEYADRRAGNAQ